MPRPRSIVAAVVAVLWVGGAAYLVLRPEPPTPSASRGVHSTTPSSHGATSAGSAASPADGAADEARRAGHGAPKGGAGLGPVFGDDAAQPELTLEQLGLPPVDTAQPVEGGPCAALQKDRKSLQLTETMITKLPPQNTMTVGAQRLRAMRDRLSRSVERRSKAIAKRGETCADE